MESLKYQAEADKDDVLGCDRQTAVKYLEANNGDIESAFRSYQNRELAVHECVTFLFSESTSTDSNTDSSDVSIREGNRILGISQIKFKEAINRAIKEYRYLLIDLYNPSLPLSQTFSQKVWSNIKVVNLILLNFVFAQVISTSEEGLAYQNAFPDTNNTAPPTTHFALLNPFTRQRAFYWNDLREPEDVFQVLSAIVPNLPPLRPVANPNTINPLPVNQNTSTSSNPSITQQQVGLARGNAPMSSVTHRPITKKRPLVEDDTDDTETIGHLSKRRATNIDERLSHLSITTSSPRDGLSSFNEPLPTELPPIQNGDNAFRVALRFPSGERTILELVPNLTLESLFRYFEHHGFPASGYDLVHFYPNFRLNDLPRSTRVDEIGLEKWDTLYLQYKF
nr:UBX [Hymenolepis microstoma]